ncbi:double zinc ribbon domain-containing protein [Methanobrevibacter sp.]|uniref:double zinc ribbon domain-containing protein n=1 Tax=Methanobrevibacter sp. TaxID=66852 RepID=UPI00386FCB1C
MAKKKSGVANIVNKKTGDKYTIRSTNLERRIKDYFIKLEKGKHHNVYLQRDYNRYGRQGFKPEIVVSDCRTQSEINRLGKLEIEKNGIKSYNIREDDVTFEGGDLEFPTNSENDYSDLFKYLAKYIDTYNLRESTQKELEHKIETGNILTKDELCDEIRNIVQKDKLLKLINESNINPIDKRKLEYQVEKGVILSENGLIKEIDKLELNNKSTKDTKPKKQTSNKNKKSRKYSNQGKNSLISNGFKCPNCGFINKNNNLFCTKCGSSLKDNRINEYKVKTIYCPECGSANKTSDRLCCKCNTKLDNPYKSVNRNTSSSKGIGRLFKINDKKTKEQRFSKSKIISFIVFLVCFIGYILSAISYISAPMTIMGMFLILLISTIYSLIPYVICRILGYVIRLIL